MVIPEKLTVNKIKVLLQEGNPDQDFLALCHCDDRQAVRNLALAYLKRLERHAQEDARLEKLFVFEEELWSQGYTNIAGIDEAGRGPLAGPVVAAAVILPGKLKISGLNDSKVVPERKRQELARQIRQQAVAWSIGVATVEEIDTLNILGATKTAMTRAVEGLGRQPDHLLIDAVKLTNLTLPQKPVIDGDALSASIAAASILAKVYRDSVMDELHKSYPYYNFGSNKGYLTAEHALALKEYGPCPWHRTSFAPVRTVGTGKSTV
ncbi:MAG TPA: ribonuclease HII [Verrucomicrobiae bacterium]|nr:ribonuclease HII [Verrucomicrobiae bacterium]